MPLLASEHLDINHCRYTFCTCCAQTIAGGGSGGDDAPSGPPGLKIAMGLVSLGLFVILAVYVGATLRRALAAAEAQREVLSDDDDTAGDGAAWETARLLPDLVADSGNGGSGEHPHTPASRHVPDASQLLGLARDWGQPLGSSRVQGAGGGPWEQVQRTPLLHDGGGSGSAHSIVVHTLTSPPGSHGNGGFSGVSTPRSPLAAGASAAHDVGASLHHRV
jgi:hypothetical protein